MQQKRRTKGSGTLFRKSNGRYALRFEDPDGRVSSTTLLDEAGQAITNKTDAMVAAEKICKERQKLQNIESKVEYLAKVATAKKLITQIKVDLFDIWRHYLNQPNRPDSGAVTLLAYERYIKMFLAYCKQHDIDSVAALSEERASEYMGDIWARGVSARTYNKHLQALKLVFRICMKEDSPFQRLKAKQIETESRRAFTPEQINAIFKKLEDPTFYLLYKEEMRIVLMLGLAFGLRLHDATCFKWSYIEGDLARFKPAKTKRKLHQDLLLPIPAILQEQFKLAEIWRVDDYVLPNVARRYKTNDSGISQDVNRLLEAAGIKTKEEAPDGVRRQNYVNTKGEKCIRHIGRYSFHSFRHTFCSIAANAGNDLSVIRSIVGHTNITMTEHYTHYNIESKRQVIASLPLPHAQNVSTALEGILQRCTPQQLAQIGKWLDEHLSNETKTQLLATV